MNIIVQLSALPIKLINIKGILRHTLNLDLCDFYLTVYQFYNFLITPFLIGNLNNFVFLEIFKNLKIKL